MKPLPHYLSYANIASFPTDARIAVIGAGLAGCATAYALGQRGYSVDIYDQHPSFAQATSGNLLGILKPYYTVDRNASDLFHSGGFHRTRAFILKHSIEHLACGAVQLLAEKEQQRYQNILSQRNDVALQWLEGQALTEKIGVETIKPAIYYPTAMAVSPALVCKQLLALSKARTYFNCEVMGLNPIQQQWQIETNNRTSIYDVVILCGGYGLIQQYASELPVYPAYGQVSYLSSSYPNSSIVMEKGYLLPNQNDIQVMGATFRDNNDVDSSIRDQDHDENIALIAAIMGEQPSGEIVGVRVGLRCVTSDHIPMVGAVADKAVYAQQFSKSLGYGQRSDMTPYYQQGLYINSGYGSKGLCSCLYASEIIADLIKGEIDCHHQKVVQALHPLRFWARALKQRTT